MNIATKKLYKKFNRFFKGFQSMSVDNSFLSKEGLIHEQDAQDILILANIASNINSFKLRHIVIDGEVLYFTEDLIQILEK